MCLTNEPFRGEGGPKSPVIVWLNVNSKAVHIDRVRSSRVSTVLS